MIMRSPSIRSRCVLMALLMLVSLMVAPVPQARAYTFTGCKSWRLDGGQAELYRKGNGINSYYSGVIDNAATKWNPKLKRGSFQGVSSGGSLVIERYSYVQGWFALASWNCVGGSYSGSTGIALNSRTMDPLASWQDRYVLIHEFGHIVGLNHSSSGCGVAVMRSDAVTGDSSCSGGNPPWSDDINGAHARY